MMGPFCPEGGTSSHETVKDLASTEEKIMFSGEEVGSACSVRCVLLSLDGPVPASLYADTVTV